MITNHEYLNYTESTEYAFNKIGFMKLMFIVIFYHFIVKYVIINLMTASYIGYYDISRNEQVKEMEEDE